MRLWHYKFIPVLPKDVLIKQWEECIEIKNQWKNETLDDKLVNYIMDYRKECFVSYTHLITLEMSRRNIEYDEKDWEEISNMCMGGRLNIFDIGKYIEYKEHNNKYYIQCYYNLEERHDRGLICDMEWQKIRDMWLDY